MLCSFTMIPFIRAGGEVREHLSSHTHTPRTHHRHRWGCWGPEVQSIAQSPMTACGRSGARIASPPQFPLRTSPVVMFLLSRKILGHRNDSVRCVRTITGSVLSFSHDSVLLGKQFWLETGYHRSWPPTWVVWQQMSLTLFKIKSVLEEKLH